MLKRLLVVAILAATPRAALACPVCFGQNDSPMANAMNLGILAMLVVVVGMLASFATFFVYLRKRARLVAAEEGRLARADRFTGSDPQEGTAQC